MLEEKKKNNLIIKHFGCRGTRSIRKCLNCGNEFSELNTRIREGGGKFCCNDCYKEYRKKNKKNKKETNRLYQKKHRYGLSEEEYYHLFEIQHNRCAICNEEFSNKLKGVIDHNHITKKVRGLLCHKCNTMLGMARENEKILMNAILYLRNSEIL